MSYLRDEVLATIQVIAENPGLDEVAIVDELRCLHYEELRAELLVAFVPLGLARALIYRLPVQTRIVLSDHVLVLTADRRLEVPLLVVPEFVEAFALGEETFTTGIISQEHFSQVVRFSVEMNLINESLNAGKVVAEVAAPILLRLGEVAGFEEWYRTVSAK